jgi:hypothetical protein
MHVARMQLVRPDSLRPNMICMISFISIQLIHAPGLDRDLGRDNGDCNHRFLDAGREVRSACDRSKCRPYDQDYFDGVSDCHEACFKASCDWSQSMCSAVKSNLKSCPIFDSTVLSSIRQQQNLSLWFLKGGSTRLRFDFFWFQ